jgi:chromosome segregation ATPase
LSTYYTDTLHLGALDNISSPNVSLVAKDGSIQEAVKLVHLVLLVSVNSETKTSEYMDCIQRISDVDARNTLLELIEECKQGVDDKKSGIVAEYDMDARIQSEVSNVLARYEHLERAYAELEEHNSVLQDNYDKMKRENASLHEQVSQAGGMSKLQVEIAESKAKSQIEYLQKEMQDLEEQLVEKDKKLAGSEMKTKELVMQVRSSG